MRVIVLSICIAYSLLAADAKPPAQAARGQAAFLDENAPAHLQRVSLPGAKGKRRGA